MPELPEVEVLVRHLDPLLRGKTVRHIQVRRERVLRPTSTVALKRTLRGATFRNVSRRAKFLVFDMCSRRAEPVVVLGHLGMTGRMYLQPKRVSMPKHATIVLDLGDSNFVFEDTRYFGRFTLDQAGLANLGPEPLGDDFRAEDFARALANSQQAIKVKLLDQTLVAGIGNIYASEVLSRVGISPTTPASQLKANRVGALRQAIREVLEEAIRFGSTVPLNFPGAGKTGGLFYYGAAEDETNPYEERLRVYDREGKPCLTCGNAIKRIVQASRSTFFCPKCQGTARRRIRKAAASRKLAEIT